MANQKVQLEASANALRDIRLQLPCWQELLNQEGNLVAPLMRALNSEISLAKEREEAKRQETWCVSRSASMTSKAAWI